MSDLRDALLKAGLVSKKKASHAKREDTARSRRLGAKGRHKEEVNQKQAHAERVEKRRQEDRDRERDRFETQQVREETARLLDIARNGAVKAGRHGRRRFHFVACDGKIPFLEMSDELGRELELGQAAIVQLPESKESLVIAREAAAKLAEARVDWICFWNRRPDPIGVS